MRSPFPGMNPYLESEKTWPAFQHQLVSAIYQLLLPALVDQYRTRVQDREFITEEPLFTSIIKTTHHEHFIEVRHRTTDRLITLIEVVSPANRLFNTGKTALVEARKSALAEGANVLWIDLILQGQSPLNIQNRNENPFDYHLALTRANLPTTVELYTNQMAKRLPRCKVPLASEEAELVLDVQQAVNRAYELGHFAAKVEMKGLPPGKWSPEQEAWLQSILKPADS
jgi:hypothetical protein